MNCESNNPRIFRKTNVARHEGGNRSSKAQAFVLSQKAYAGMTQKIKHLLAVKWIANRLYFGGLKRELSKNMQDFQRSSNPLAFYSSLVWCRKNTLEKTRKLRKNASAAQSPNLKYENSHLLFFMSSRSNRAPFAFPAEQTKQALVPFASEDSETFLEPFSSKAAGGGGLADRSRDDDTDRPRPRRPLLLPLAASTTGLGGDGDTDRRTLSVSESADGSSLLRFDDLPFLFSPDFSLHTI